MADYLLSIDLGTKNFAYCVLDLKTERILRWDCVSIGDPSEKTNSESIVISLANKLSELKLTRVPNETKKKMIIIFEHQPPCNIRTVILSGQLQMYFALEKLCCDDLDLNFCKIQSIESYNSSMKLKYYEPPEPILLKIKPGYYRNKMLAIEHCKRVLDQKKESEWIPFFNKSLKKDDLSDSYLMGLAFKKFKLS